MKAKKPIPLVSLENYDLYEDKYLLNSPRSLEACSREGVNPKDLRKLKAEDFEEEGVSKKIQAMRLKFYESKRKG